LFNIFFHDLIVDYVTCRSLDINGLTKGLFWQETAKN
jgi:hypothetical protein